MSHFLHSQPPPTSTAALHTLLHCGFIFIKGRVFSGGRRICCRCLHQRDLLLHWRGGKILCSTRTGWRVLGGRGDGRRAAAEATGDFVKGLALRLWDFEEGEDEKDDEEGGENEENPGPA